MFDIGFLELVFIALIGLLVIGPDRLPGAIRTATLWIGRFKHGFHAIKNQIAEEIDADELKRQLHNEAVMKSIEEAKQDMQSVTESISKANDSLEYDIQDVIGAANKKPPAEQETPPKSDD